MQVLTTIAEVRAARARFPSTGFVPTMGYLHAGHISLVEQARAECGAAIASIFVNPTQFGPNEDLDRYPRDTDGDLAKLAAAGADLVFLPTPELIYPPGFSASIDLGDVTRRLEGAVRPHHFAGVATVVTKLLNIVQPTRAYFGQKDAQQCVVIRKLVRDLDLPVEVVIGDTVREPDGLALSSRNSYLTAEQRAEAPVLYRALGAARDAFMAGERDAEALRATIRGVLGDALAAATDYVSIADPDTLEELEQVGSAALASLAVRFGATRLIDNVRLGP
jgi:pantoate--beta-alanine ligase